MILLVSCDNFLNGLDAKNQLEDGISYANARSIEVLVNAAEGTGTTVPSGQYTAKSGYPFEVSFTESADYAFAGWKAVFESDGTEASEGIHFDDPSALKTNVIISTEGIKVVPQCIRRIYIDGEPLPKYEATGVSRDRSITVNFSEPPAADSFLFTEDEIPAGALPEADDSGIWAYRLNGLTYFKNIEITGADEISLAAHFKKPEVDGNLLTIAVDKSNPIEIDTGSSFKIIKVTISDKIKASNGITINSGKTWRYQVTNETDEKATVTLSSEVAEGSVYLAGTRDYSIGQKLTLAFTESADYQFIRWDYDSSVVHVAEPLSASTTALIMEKSTGTQIKAVCAPRLRVLSFTPQNDVLSPTVSKNSSIVITFSQNLPSDEGMLNNISIAVGGSPVKNSFSSPRVNGNIITFSADKTNMLDVYAGQTKTVTVTVPADFYYETEEGYKVTYGGNGISFDYKIDNSTIEKAEIIFSSVQGSGTITPESGNVKYYSIGEEVAISFLVSDGWQFNGWKVTGADESVLSKIKIADENLPSTKLTILEAVTGVTVSADVSECLRVISKSPSAESNYKDSDIVLTFNKSLDSECSSMLNKIRISWDGNNLDGCYTDRILSADGKTITVKSTAVLSVPKNSEKTISVFIPSDFFYKNANGLKIYHEEESFSFKVNHTTKEKAKITYSVINGETETPFSPAGAAGTINRNSYEEYNLGEEVDLSFDLNPGYQFYGWKITDAGGALVTDTVSYVNSSSSSLQPTLVMNKPAEGLRISAVCYKRPSISTSDVSPYSSNSAEEFAKNKPIELNFAHAIKEGTEKYIEIGYTVSNISQSTYFSRSLSSDQKTVTFTPIKMLPVENAFETVTVTVPHDKVYYLAQDGKTKITPSDDDFSWSYRVNSSTLTKTIVRMDATEASGSVIKVNGDDFSTGDKQTVNIEQSFDLEYPVANGYIFGGWKISSALTGYTVDPAGFTTSGKITVKNGTKDYFELEIDSTNSAKAKITSKDAIGNGTNGYGISVYTKDIVCPVVESVKINNITNIFNVTSSGCDSKIYINFSKPIDTDTATLSRSGEINITKFGSSNSHYETYFTSAWSSDNKQLVLSPTNEVSKLVPNTEDTFGFVITLNANRKEIKDSDACALILSESINNSFEVPYTINGERETTPPVWYSLSLYSDNTSSKKTLSATEYNNWSTTKTSLYKHGTFSQNHVGKSVYYNMRGYDMNSGVKALRITETYYKSYSNETVTSTPVVSEKTATYIPASYDGIYSFEGTYNLKTSLDGVIKLDFQLVDNAGNVNAVRTWYVIKDTAINASTIGVALNFRASNNSKDNVSFTLSNGNDLDNFFDKTTSWHLYGNQSLEAYWGYSYDSMTKITPSKEDDSNNRYSFVRDSARLTYLKVVCSDEVGNSVEVKSAIPTTPNFASESMTVANQSNGYTLFTIIPYNYSSYNLLLDSVGAKGYTSYVVVVEKGKSLADWADLQSGYDDTNSIQFTSALLKAGVTNHVYLVTCFKYDGSSPVSTVSESYIEVVVDSSGSVTSYKVVVPGGEAGSNNTLFNDPIYVSTTPIKGSGCYKVEVYLENSNNQNIINGLKNYSYSMKATNTKTSEIFTQEGTSINLPSPGTYKLHMIAKDSTGNSYKSSWLYCCENGSNSKTSTTYSLKFSDDLTPPDMGINSDLSSYSYSSPSALCLLYDYDGTKISSYNYPVDTSLKNSITYYILPRSITYCDDSVLNTYDKKTLTFNAEQITWGLPHLSSGRQGRIELPYGDIEEGSYTVCVESEDTFGNKARRFVYASNKLLNKKLTWSYDSSNKYITLNQNNSNDRAVFYYYDTNTSRWVKAFYCFSKLTAEKGYLGNNNWIKVIGSSSSAYYDVEYSYFGTQYTCNNKNIMELQNGLQVFCDQSTFVHTLYSSKKLTETNTASDITVWENKGTETGVKIASSNFTYGRENLSSVPSGYYYTTVVHFMDGTTLMSEVKQK